MDLAGLPNKGSVYGYSLINPQKRSLSNGIPVYFIQAGKHDLVRIELLFKAGNYYQAKNLTAFFTNRMLREGTVRYQARQLAETIEFYGAYLSLNTDRDRASVSMLMLEKQLPHLLPLLGEIIRQPVFPENELEQLKSRQQQEFQVNLQKVSYLASRQFSAMVFGESHPYGRPTHTDDFKQVNRNELAAFYNQYYSASSCVILVTGKAVKGLYDKIDRVFGERSWLITELPESEEIPFQPFKSKRDYIAKNDAVQSAVRVGKMTVKPGHPDHVGLKVLNTLFGGYFGSRLMKNIREDKGYTYGISSMLMSLEKTGFWAVAADVGAEKSQATIDEIYREIDKLRTRKVSTSELSLVKNYMLGSFLRSVDGPFELADKFRDLLLMGLGEDYYSTYIDQIKAANPAAIQALAMQYMDPDSFYELIVGKKPKN
jgi:predicted Zn-dependent peptidase